MSDRILITGGAGFVGSSLAVAFRKDRPESEIIALDNLKRRGSELNLPRLAEAGVAFQRGDIRNPEDLEQAGPVALLIECSAEASVHAGYDGQDPAYLVNTNLVGAFNDLLVMLHNQQCVAQVPQSMKCLEQSSVVTRMQTDGRLVQYIEHAAQSASQLTCQADALSFTIGQRCGCSA